MERFTINEHILLRFAEENDAELLLAFVRELAEYEHLLDQVEADVESLRRYIFAEKKAEAIIGEYDGEAAGFALFFHNFSTFAGKPGLYVEDLFVKPAFRGKGLGKALLGCCARVAAARRCGRLEWSCLDWNEPSIAFYKSRGARPMTEWTTYRVTGGGIQKLARALV